MSYAVLYLFLAGLCLFGIQFAPTGMDIREVMNRMNRLRPIVAIILIFGHCALPYAKMPLLLLPFHKASTFCVGYFFVLSGYGLAYSVDNKRGYLDHFGNKIVNLIWITVFSSVVSMLLKSFAFQTWEPLKLINWYMPAIIVMYLVFYAVYRLFPEAGSKRVFWLFVVLFLLIAAVCGYGKLVDRNYRNYFISELAFPFGTWIYEYADEFSAFLKKKTALLFIVLLELVFSGAALTIPELGLMDLIFHNLMLFPFVLLLMWILDKISVSNCILKNAARYTTYIYLFQFPFLEILQQYYLTAQRPFDMFYFLGCLCLTCILAYVVQRLQDSIRAVVHK